MNDVWRLFAAVEVTPEIKERVDQAAAYLRESGWRARWVAPENSHLTLKFFGNVPSDQISELSESLRDAAASTAPFQLRTDGLGVFPSPRRPRVVWLGVDGETDVLTQLHRQVDLATEKIGFEREKRPYHGHITVGRLRPEDRVPSGDTEKQLAGAPTDPSLLLPVNRVTLFRSELRRTGAIYSVVDQFSLGR